MWLFDSENFLSVVSYDPTKDRYKDSPHRAFAEAQEDPQSFLLVRARRESDLLSVQRQLGFDIMVVEDIYADYSFRALVDRHAFKRYLSMQVDRIDYGAHFKEVVRSRSEKAIAGKKYSAMMSIWTAMAGLQETRPYSGEKQGVQTTRAAGTTKAVSDVSRFKPKPVTTKDAVPSRASDRFSWGGMRSGQYSSAAKVKESSSISVTELGELLLTRTAEELTADEVASLDYEALDVYLTIRSEGLDGRTLDAQTYAQIADTGFIADADLAEAVEDDVELEAISVEDVVDEVVTALEATEWFEESTEVAADETSSVTEFVLGDGSVVRVTVEVHLAGDAAEAPEDSLGSPALAPAGVYRV